MTETTNGSELRSRVLKTEPTHWRSLEFLQAENFKDLPTAARQKLKASMLANDFSQPFYVWHDEAADIRYCLDGKHRSLILEELAQEGYQIPELLPATYMACAGRQDAAELVLQYSSIYARVTQEGLYDFVTAFELDFDQMRLQVDLPDFSMPRFEQRSGIFDVADGEEPEVDVSGEMIIVKPGDMFELNGHRIICGSCLVEGDVANLMQGERARIVNCDPPYNIPASIFTNFTEKRHEDFAMAAGEMTDEQFVEFLATVMQRSVDNTFPGAIHYLFMDHRHVWHMTEAGRRVYGSPQPKQMCTWVKDSMANGSFYRSQQELCFIFSNEEAKALWHRDLIDEGGFYKDENELCFIFKNGDGAKHLSHLQLKDRVRTNVWRYASANSQSNPDRYQLKNHPTPKPVAMIADAILDTTNPGELVIDWFLGSGTCLIACEHTGRRGRFTEIEPKYVQSSIKRYLTYCDRRGLPVEFTHFGGDLTIKDFDEE